MRNDYGSIARTNNARVAAREIRFQPLRSPHASLKVQLHMVGAGNGTFDGGQLGAQRNGLEQDHSNAVNGSLVSYLTPTWRTNSDSSFARGSPPPYDGPRSAALGANRVVSGNRPFPDIAVAPNFRFGMPFFSAGRLLRPRACSCSTTSSFAKGDHFFKLGFESTRCTQSDVRRVRELALHLQFSQRLPELRC